LTEKLSLRVEEELIADVLLYTILALLLVSYFTKFKRHYRGCALIIDSL
jgi:hypothetical protein